MWATPPLALIGAEERPDFEPVVSGPRRTKRASSLAGSLRGGTTAPKHHGARTRS
ncbi:hypothetical protein PR003_g31060 [Phytophthora rubi]|uniref:Uncharacterized protein n=1 Tax=Phytophthora rubi TaxID=129364 RepID=A0A6A4BBG0_9STRA|nr:hypothetical protein PR003_g31060 [Phytophthora rubi]